MRRALAGTRPSARVGGATGQRDARRRPGGGALEVAGMGPGWRGPGNKKSSVASEALPELQLMWKGRVGPRKVQGNAVLLEGGERCVPPWMR